MKVSYFLRGQKNLKHFPKIRIFSKCLNDLMIMSLVQLSKVWYGFVRFGMVWYGFVWFGMVWYGLVWFGMIFSLEKFSGGWVGVDI